MLHPIINNHDMLFNFMKDSSTQYLTNNGQSSTASIQKFCNRIILRTENRPRNFDVEHKKNIKPSFVAFFYYYLLLKKEIPSQSQFIQFYFDLNKTWISKEFTKDSVTYLFGRLSRFYPSMIRDYHFFHLLRESGEFEDVAYSIAEDIFSKNDILVKKQGTWFGLQMRTLTKNSNYFYQKKSNRSFSKSSVISLDFPIDLNAATPVPTKGDTLLLCNDFHVKKVTQLIHQNLSVPVLA